MAPMPAKPAPITPEMAADLKESVRELPLIKEAIPLPNAPPKTGPKGPAPSTRGNTMGAAFLTNFLMLLKIFLKKNSRMPVAGLILLSLEPTT